MNKDMKMRQSCHRADEVDYGVTIAHKNCDIIYMNRQLRAMFCKNGENLIGRNLMDCHPLHAQETIKRLLREGGSDINTISPKGVNKLFFQSACKLDGEIAGLVETSMVLPTEMKHFDRG